jgi:hypothetical protein
VEKVKRNSKERTLVTAPVFPLLLLLAVCGCLHDPEGPPVPGCDMTSFIKSWETMESMYPLFIHKGIDWTEAAQAYYLQGTECTTEDELIQLAAEMTGLLEDPALFFYDRETGDTVFSFTRNYEINVDMDVLVENYLEERGYRGVVQGFGSCDPAIFPYIYFEHLPDELTDTLAVPAFDAFIQECVDLELPAVVIDLRMNPQYPSGGFTGYSKLVMSRFMPRAKVSAVYRVRCGPGYGMLTDYHPWIQPGGNAQFLGDVYLLVGDGCNHAAEDIAVNLSHFDNFCLVGDTTSGDITITAAVALNAESDWRMKYGFVTVLTNNYHWVQDVGIPPDVHIEAGPGDFAAGVDPVMEYVIQAIGAGR